MSQLWVDTGQGYMASDVLSETWRTSLQPITRFRQFCDVQAAIGTGAGEKYVWPIFGDTVDNGSRRLDETQKMPETSFPMYQGEVVMSEYGISVPSTLKYETMSQYNMPAVITKTLKNDANRSFDREAHAAFDSTILRAVGSSTATISLTDNSTPSGANNVNMLKGHVKTLRDIMEERNIPVFDGEDYMCVARPTTFSPLVDDLESVFQYTTEGYTRIVNGERGRYSSIRFVTQTNVESEGWSNGKSDAAYFFGADTVTEAIAVSEELRGKIPDDYGRGRGVAWYYIGAFAITHANTTNEESKRQARIIKWDSTT
ncbi:MAG: hypothetical protein KDE03_17655 [Rhodobacteraceae bacterium]|nr:hypothetical protein [Paracoccaceae bacterium]